MRRMHVGLRVEDLDESIDFYTRLLGAGDTQVPSPANACCPDTHR